MKKINYPLIVSDFDGTLVNRDGTITQENKSAIASYVQNGGAFAISTGRMPSGILPRAKELGLTGLAACCQGSIIVDIETGELLLDGRIPNDVTVAICEKMERLGLHIHVYDLNAYYSNMDDEALRLYENAVRVKAQVISDKPISQFVKETGLCSYKVLAMVDPKDGDKILAEMEEEDFVGCEITRSASYLVEVINAKYSKGTAVEFLAKRYNVPIEKTIAVGDQRNDLPMIKAAGLGIAVKNAAAELKENALPFDYTNEESAIAKIIEKFGYCEE